METLQINKANALTAYKQANDKGKTLLSNLFGQEVFNQKVTDRIKTFEDVLEDNNISKSEWTSSITDLTNDEIAYKQLKLLVKSLNEEWVPDWSDSDQYKYYPWFEFSSGVGFSFSAYYDLSYSDLGSRLVYKSRELAIYAGKQFTSIYNSFLY